MKDTPHIPAFGLYGETGSFPDVVHVETIAARAPAHGWHISAHRHRQLAQLFVIDQGRADARLDRLKCQLSDGDFLFVPAGCVHAFQFKPETSGLVLSFPMDVVRAVQPAHALVQSLLDVAAHGSAGSALRQGAELLWRTCQDASQFRPQKLMPLAHLVLVELADTLSAHQGNTVGQDSRRLDQLRQLVMAHAQDRWSVPEYAAAMCISPGHLSRLCRQATGQGVAAWIEGHVMEEACRLLAFTRMRVADVGYRLGYEDPSYFTKRFHKTQGQTPGAYRRRFAA